MNSLGKNYLTAKRLLFDTYYSFLNPAQRSAVYTVNDPLLILAGAGSGKTTVLVSRIAHIIRYGNAYKNEYVPDNVSDETLAEMASAMKLDRAALGDYLTRFADNPPPAWSVMAITFTNKAAGEMKNRLTAVFGEDSSVNSDIWCGTFHSVCMRLLRRFTSEAELAPGFGICDSDDSKKLALDCMKELKLDSKQLPVKSVLSAIGRAKDNLLSPDEYRNEFRDDVRARQIASVYELYQKRLEKANLLDFDDIIVRTVALLRGNTDVREYVQSRFRYISVDEYQDTNRAQFVLITLLCGKYKNVMVVGDDDQSIYKFRGATIENILTFDKTYENAEIVKLEQNFRSTKNILDAANSLIAKNTVRKGKTLWCDGETGELITVKKTNTQLDEARYISDEITRLMFQNGYRFRDFAVLYRTNAQSRSIEQALAKSAVPYRMLGSLRFFDRAEIKDILAYLAVLNNPADSLRLKRIINIPKRGIGASSIEKAEYIANSLGVPLIEVLRDALSFTALPQGAAKSMQSLYALFAEMRESMSEFGVAKTIEKIAELTGYREMLIAAGEEEADRLDNIGELISTAAQYEKDAEAPSLSEFLEDVALVSDIDRYDESADAVVLMTIHSAKGLEFPIVFLPGMEEGLFPGYQSIMNPSEIEEERRLMYVALTRAKKQVIITHAYERMYNGSTMHNTLSRFAEELPTELVYEIDDTYANGAPKSYRFDDDDDTAPSYKKKKPYGIRRTEKKLTPPPVIEFAPGDSVRHTTFGVGKILSAKPMGSDIIYEIEFEKVGTKKLMATYARLTNA